MEKWKIPNANCKNIRLYKYVIRESLINSGVYSKRQYDEIGEQTSSKITNLYTSGKQLEFIKSETKLSRKVIFKVLTKAGIKPDFVKMRAQYMIQNLIKNIDIDRLKYLANRTVMSDITKEFRISATVAKIILKHFNIPFNKKKVIERISAENKNLIDVLWSEGQTLKLIAKTVSVRLSLLKHYLKSEGLRRGYGLFSMDQAQKFVRYSHTARTLTAVVIRRFKLLKKHGYHWHHQLSIVDGFRNNVPPELISCRANLQLITAEENTRIGCKSEITYEEFKQMVTNFMTTNIFK